MIKFDYVLERDEGDEIKTFIPDKIPKDLPNLAYIEGPNSAGKSTLLNILALGFHGLKKDKLNIALKSKLNDLANSSHQKLKFEVEVTNADETLKLVSKKDAFNGEIKVYETIDGVRTLLIPEKFHNKYNLIYDIPDNPTDRLNQLVYEIRDIQKMYGNRLGAFRNHLLSTINEIRRGRDPKRLEDLKGLISKGVADMSRINEGLEVDEQFLTQLEKYYFARMYIKKGIEIDSIEEQIRRLETKIGQAQGKTRKISKRYQTQFEKVKKFLEGMTEKQQAVSSLIEPFLPKDERHHLALWNRINIDGAIEGGEIESSLDSEILALKRVLTKQFDPNKERKDLVEARVYTDLIDFLNSYRHSDVILPGEKTIDEFISQLEEASKKHQDLKIKAENFDKVNGILDDLREKKRDANKMIADLLKLKKSFSEEEETAFDEGEGQELVRMKGKRDALNQSYEYCRMECAKVDINDSNVNEIFAELDDSEILEPYRVYDDTQLSDALNDKRRSNMALQREKKSKSDTVRLHRAELERQEKLESHKYQEKLPELEALLIKVQQLEQKLSKDYDSKIGTIIEKKVNKGGKNDEYFEEVAKYLGKRVGYIRHGEQSYKVNKIDLVDGNILTVSGKIIRLSDMGTGQSQSAYLAGLLNTDDKRRIIAIFDEVAMMDSLSLEPIYDKFRELYEQNRLLIGVVVQKGDAVRIVSKIEA